MGYYNGFVDRGIFTGNGGALTTVIKKGDPLFGSTVDALSLGTSGLDSGGDLSLAFETGQQWTRSETGKDSQQVIRLMARRIRAKNSSPFFE